MAAFNDRTHFFHLNTKLFRNLDHDCNGPALNGSFLWICHPLLHFACRRIIILIFLFQGMYVLAGFSDKLRLMNLLIDDLKTFRELPLRNCSSCAFSWGGHLFAAVSHNLIAIYSSVDFRNTVMKYTKPLIWDVSEVRRKIIVTRYWCHRRFSFGCEELDVSH